MVAWLTGWGKRKSHVINQQVGAGAGYSVLIKVYKGAGTDGTEALFGGLTGGKIYCGGNCRDDFGDIRFTTDDETTLETYMLEYISSGVYAYFWLVLSDDVGAGNVSIYVYYDNASETTTSTNIMEDFTTYTINDGDVTVTDAQHIVHHVNENDDEWAYIDKTSIVDYWVQGKIKWIGDGAVESYAFPCAVAEMVEDRKYWIDNAKDYVTIMQAETDNVYIEKMNGGIALTKVGDLTVNTYYWYVLKRLGTTNTLYIYSDEAKTVLVGSQSLTMGNALRYLFAANNRNRGAATRTYQYSENMYFRHTISPEVTHGAWGDEETVVKPISSIVPLMQVLDMI